MNKSNQPAPPKLSSMFQYKALSKYEGLIGKLKCRAPTTYIGVEIEIENVNQKHDAPNSFRFHEDGSLKLRGAEFVSIPIHVCYIEEELKRLLGCLDDFTLSSRCSVHIHLNGRDFTKDELASFILLYLIFERSLYRMSGNRWDSIFCVPLYHFSQEVGNFMDALFKDDFYMSWHKYSGLNLLPLWDKGRPEGRAIGTVEFRQMEGTFNIERIVNWINMIVSLKITAKEMPSKEIIALLKVMNTDSSYTNLALGVFKEWAGNIIDQPTFKEDVEKCILRTKYMLASAEKAPGIPKAEAKWIDNMGQIGNGLVPPLKILRQRPIQAEEDRIRRPKAVWVNHVQDREEWIIHDDVEGEPLRFVVPNPEEGGQ
jgi:hypothetical protein